MPPRTDRSSRYALKQDENSAEHLEWLRETFDQPWDIVVIGGGNAALVSALSATDLGARVLLIERSPWSLRGGNSRHTRNIRCAHDFADDYVTGPYTYDELWNDLCGIGSGPSNERLAAFTLEQSQSAPGWMSDHGVGWQPPLTGTLNLGRTNRFFLGGGKALINSYHRTAERAGVRVVYDATVTRLLVEGDRCSSVVVESGDREYLAKARSVVCASGGFEANIEWLSRYWGSAAENYHIRGPRYNDGLVLQQLLDAGAATAGEERGFHAVAVDARSPKFDGGIATRLDSIPFGITVNREGQRFADEGEDIWPKRYATWGANLAGQPDQIGYTLWDHQADELFLPPMYGSLSAPSISELAVQLGLDPTVLTETVRVFNEATAPDARTRFSPAGLDGVTTAGILPPKTNWALPLDKPPFHGVPVRPGITFTYMGVAVDESARIVRQDGSRFENVFAAGEIMSGNILTTGYLAGFGMTIGTVWGRVAGREAAQLATS